MPPQAGVDEKRKNTSLSHRGEGQARCHANSGKEMKISGKDLLFILFLYLSSVKVVKVLFICVKWSVFMCV